MPKFPADVSDTLRDHIKASERLMPRAYFDPVGVPTAGYGHIKGITADMARKQRSLFPWSTLSGARYYAIGTNLKYYLLQGTTPIDITPIRLTVDPMSNNPFQTVSAGSTTVKVTDAGNGSVVGHFAIDHIARRKLAFHQMPDLKRTGQRFPRNH